MLKFNSCYADDDKAEKIMETFINEIILAWFEEEIKIIKNEAGYLISEGYKEMREFWLPEGDWLTEDDAACIFISLHDKLVSDQKEELCLPERYVVHKILNEIADVEEDAEKNGFRIEPLPDIFYLYDVICLEGIAEEAECKPEEILKDWRNLRLAVDYLFEDTDYMLIDLIPAEYIKN